jgi:hypothetical protein
MLWLSFRVKALPAASMNTSSLQSCNKHAVKANKNQLKKPNFVSKRSLSACINDKSAVTFASEF